MTTRRFLFLFAFLTGFVFSILASAQAYPTRPVRMLVPFPAGGAIDGLARALAQQVGDSMGQPVVVENRPGGSSIISNEACAKAVPDGHTICQVSVEGVVFVPYLFPKLPYDPNNDFAAITQIARIEGVIVANGAASFNTLTEMIDHAKAKPGSLNWASFGTASFPHVYLEWIKQQAAVNITHVPYKGSAQTVPALLAGEVQLTYVGIGIMLPHIRAGKAKALAVVGKQRFGQLPGVPTLAELGLDPQLTSWTGLMAPAKTPRAVIERLNTEFVKAMNTPRILAWLGTQGFVAIGNPSAEFADIVRSERANANKLLRGVGIRPGDAPS